MHKVAVLVGSLRRGSINREYAHVVAKHAKPKLDFHFVEIGDLPLYNQDLEADLPAAVARFKREIDAADAVLFVTPEFNKSHSSAIANAIEWGSRPWGHNSWDKKPGAVLGTARSNVGTAAAQVHLRSVLASVDVAQLPGPSIFSVYRDGLFGENGEINDERLKQQVPAFIDAFADWISRVKQPKRTV